MDKIDILLHNIKNHPWHLYPAFKIDEETGKALLEKLGSPEFVCEIDDGGLPHVIPSHNERSSI